ncbi:MAG: hypothetical protein KDE31_33750 [Caldilineaceae bacterium]|nr:hypothetical protein [Caldilineaceae bacterium]
MSFAFKYKVIKPSRLKQKEMRLELLNGMRQVANGMLKDFEATTKSWDHKPKFERIVSLSGVGPQVLVGTDDEQYRYVNDGTRAHDIRPVRAKRLRFAGTYTAKTSPGVIGSGSGGSGDDIIYTTRVRHPGTKARNFDKMIAKKWEKPFKARMHEAMRRAADKSGNKYP